ncbi:hypothetical protein GCM10010533_05120 [Mycolicibacterium pallens]
MAEKYRISDRLILQTGISDEELAALYRGSDALLFPSLWEGFGLPALEALKTGTKVVYSETAASVSEICAGGQFAVADAADSAEFRKQMALAVDSPCESSTDLTQFKWQAVATKVEAVIRHVGYGMPLEESAVN